jgi:hypothetical protein
VYVLEVENGVYWDKRVKKHSVLIGNAKIVAGRNGARNNEKKIKDYVT